MDIDGRESKILGRDSQRFPAIISSEWTFLDVPERYWMVGRVPTKLIA
jgi:hypothetical protein